MSKKGGKLSKKEREVEQHFARLRMKHRDQVMKIVMENYFDDQNVVFSQGRAILKVCLDAMEGKACSEEARQRLCIEEALQVALVLLDLSAIEVIDEEGG